MDIFAPLKKTSFTEVEGTPSSVSFCETDPYSYVVSSSARVNLFVPGEDQIVKSFTKFKDTAYGACIRSDGALVAAGCGDGRIRVFDVISRTMLRNIRAHSSSCRAVAFLPDNRVVSGGDDGAIMISDPAIGQRLHTIDNAHSDHIRAICAAPFANAQVAATGGYDGFVRLWDLRPSTVAEARECGRVVRPFVELNHGAPVEAVTFIGAGGLVAVAGGHRITFWRVIGSVSTTPLATVTTHIKGITSLTTYGGFLVSAGLDGLVKAVDLSTYTVASSVRAPAPVLAVAMHPRGHTLVCALADGRVMVRHGKASEAGDVDLVLKKGARTDQSLDTDVEWIRRIAGARGGEVGRSGPVGGTRSWWTRKQDEVAGELTVNLNISRDKLTKCERLIRQFEYRRALDRALCSGDPEVIAGLFLELHRRGASARTVATANSTMLVALIRFCRRNLGRPAYGEICRLIVDVIIDCHADALTSTPDLAVEAAALKRRIKEETEMLRDTAEILGMIEAIEIDF